MITSRLRDLPQLRKNWDSSTSPNVGKAPKREGQKSSLRPSKGRFRMLKQFHLETLLSGPPTGKRTTKGQTTDHKTAFPDRRTGRYNFCITRHTKHRLTLPRLAVDK